MLHATDRLDLSHIVQSGGWRVFLRGAEPELSSMLLTAKEPSDRDDPVLTLAKAFVQAKHGRPEAARHALDSAKSALNERGERSVAVLCDLALVDAHVRVYEDRPIRPKEAKRLQWVLEALVFFHCG